MAESTPQGSPSGSGQSASGSGASGPSFIPPPAAAGGKGDCGCNGGALSSGPAAGYAAGGVMPNVGEAAPTFAPASGGVGGVTAWLNNKRITALWSINQNRNSWVHVDGIGWRKVANNSDSAIVALTILGSHAREKNSAVNYREESDGMVKEMYVF
jgi:hypothetical protein